MNVTDRLSNHKCRALLRCVVKKMRGVLKFEIYEYIHRDDKLILHDMILYLFMYLFIYVFCIYFCI